MARFRFYDMCSGGGEKLFFKHITIEAADEDAACAIFQREFKRDPRNVTCPCCGPDYSIYEVDALDRYV